MLWFRLRYWKRGRYFYVLAGIGLVLFLLFVFLWMTQPLFSDAEIEPCPDVETESLEHHIQVLSMEFSPRSFSNLDNLQRAADYVYNHFKKTNARVSFQTFDVGGIAYQNVRALFGNGERERIVIGAHYDAFEEFPGADDNASGVAALIELSRLLDQKATPCDVELVAFSLEEPPFFRTEFMGSAVHASMLRREGVSVSLMISIEMIGCFSDEPGSQRHPFSLLRLFYPSIGNFITVVGNVRNGSKVRRVKQVMRAASPLPVYSINAPRFVPGIDFSDQLNYWNAGFNAVMITDTSFYRNPAYHTDRDTADLLDYERMSMVIQGIYAVCQNYCGKDQ